MPGRGFSLCHCFLQFQGHAWELSRALLGVTDVLPLLSALPCNPACINGAPQLCPYSSAPDGDKKDSWFKNYRPPFLPHQQQEGED